MFESLNEQKRDFILGFAVSLIAFCVYANSLHNQFVWDDNLAILANADIKGNLLDLFSKIDNGRITDVTPYYRPLTYVSYLIEYRLHGLAPNLVRFCNVLLHSFCALLVYALSRSLGLSMGGALLSGLLFALHPINVETVDFNSCGRNVMLAAFFVLASILVHRSSIKHNSFVRSCAGALLFLCGLLSKETGVLALPFIVISEVMKRHDFSQGIKNRMFLRMAPYTVVLVFYMVLRNAALSRAGVSLEIAQGLTERLSNNIYIIPRFLLNIFLPFQLYPKYYLPDNLQPYIVLLIIGWGCVLLLLWWFLIRDSSMIGLFGVTWFVAFWLPVSGIVKIASDSLADRNLYLPAIGIWLIVADQSARWLFTRETLRCTGVFVTSMILVILAVVTFRQSMIWRTDLTLFGLLAERYPDKAFVHHNLGCAYLDKENNLYRAQQSFEKAFRLDPAFPRLRTQMGYICMLREDFEGAVQHYDHAIYLNPLDTEALLNRGEALERLGRYGEALESYRRFLALTINELPQARDDVTKRIYMLEQRLGG